MVRTTVTIGVALVVVAALAMPASAQNWVFNGGFARDTRGWSKHEAVQWSTDDAGNSAFSGSILAINADQSNAHGVDQCLAGPPIVPGNAYAYGGSIRIPSGQATTGFGGLGLRWYPQPNCVGNPISQPRASSFTADGVFHDVGQASVAAPAGAVSVEFTAYGTKNEATGVFKVYLDDLYFGTVGTTTGPPAMYLPTGAHLVGFGDVNWRTDVQVHNPGPSQATYLVELLKRDQANQAPQSASFSLAAGGSARFGDIVLSIFGFDGGAAALRITPAVGTLAVTSRTYNQITGGTYGQFVPGIPEWDAVLYGGEARLLQLTHDLSTTSGYRTNIGFLNVVNMTITIEVKLFDGSGALLATLTYDLRPYEFRQIDKIFRNVPAGAVADGYAILRTTTPNGRFLTYASVIDNATGDPICVQPARF